MKRVFIILFAAALAISTSCTKEEANTVSITTSEVSGVTSTSASCGGSITSDGGSSITARGVVWSTSPEPTADLATRTVNGSGTGTFTSSITGLSPNTQYYIRAYAVNGLGTYYGNQISFNTIYADPNLPVVSTANLVKTSNTSATCGGNVTSAGTTPVLVRGVVWDIKPDPTVLLSTKTIDGSGTGIFTSTIKNLSLNVTYYVRAYATNSSGTAYGEQKTIRLVSLTVTTSAVTNITTNSAECGGTINTYGTETVSSRGVVWNTSVDPTVDLSTKTVDGSGTGNFTSVITGLSSGVTYYVRAYAVTSEGTFYGNNQTFVPTIDTKGDLSAQGTSNCYIVSNSGDYRFKATVKGCGSESVGTPTAAKVLWESTGSSIAPAEGFLVSNVKLSDGYVHFTASNMEGNAVIAVTDKTGNILWSWHIWMTDAPAGQLYNQRGAILFDRFLGATSCDKGKASALGLMYQWGRKDPFLGSSSISEGIVAKSTGTWQKPIVSSAATGTIAYSVAHPMCFILANSLNGDWYYTGTDSTDETRWTAKDKAKSIYDPCPPGWRVPNDIWYSGTAIFNKGGDYPNRGADLGQDSFKRFTDESLVLWYPMTGILSESSGNIEKFGTKCFPRTYKAAAAYPTFIQIFAAKEDMNIYIWFEELANAAGTSVRCMSDTYEE